MWKLDSYQVRKALTKLESSVSIFGADVHRFRLNPVLSEAELAAFEQDYAIKLPHEYRHFLTEIGNGGAGPSYGVFPLRMMDDNFNLRYWQQDDDFVGNLSEPFTFDEAWNDLTGKPGDDLADEEEYWKQEERFEERYWSGSVINGAIPICHLGCALRILLIVTGNQAGFLWDDKRSEFAGLRRVILAEGSRATFASWYEEWLSTCLASHP